MSTNEKTLQGWGPVRRIGRGRRGRRGYASFRGQPVAFESAVEFAFVARVRRDPSVSYIVSQPCRIPWRDVTGRRRAYVPDYLVAAKDASGGATALFLIEVKPRSAVMPKPDFVAKLSAAAAWAEQRGAAFALVLDTDVNCPRGLCADGAGLAHPPLINASKPSRAAPRLHVVAGPIIAHQPGVCRARARGSAAAGQVSSGRTGVSARASVGSGSGSGAKIEPARRDPQKLLGAQPQSLKLLPRWVLKLPPRPPTIDENTGHHRSGWTDGTTVDGPEQAEVICSFLWNISLRTEFMLASWSRAMREDSRSHDE